ncbi:MAG: hypothetical protein CML42_06910, partial [Rhodobacteraceae bacterium]|nr:hypothetical protein [Paracoccaceae bacterium]
MTKRNYKDNQHQGITSVSQLRLSRAVKVLLKLSTILLGLIIITCFVGYIGFVGRDISLPSQINDFLKSQANLNNKFEKFEYENTSIKVQSKNLKPILTLTKVRLESSDYGKIQFPEMKIELSLIDLMKGNIYPLSIKLLEPEIKISRDESGTLGFGFFNNLSNQPSSGVPSKISNFSLNTFFNESIFQRLEKIDTKNLKLVYENKRNGKRISFIDGQAKLLKRKEFTEISLFASLEQEKKSVAQFSLSLKDKNDERGSQISMKFDELDSSNLSSQVYSLGWFKHFDGSVSGAISGSLNPNGEISEFAGAITLENGFVRNLSGTDSYFLNTLNTHIRYKAEDKRMHFDNISISAPELKLDGEGHADISNFILGVPDTFLGQLTFSDIQLDPDGLFVEPVRFNSGLVDFRYNLSQSEVEIGQLVLRTDVSELISSGLVSSKKDGWNISLDTKLNEVEYKNLLDLWPINFKPKSRLWFNEKVRAGKIKNAISSIRIVPNQDTEVMTTFDFLDAEIEVLKGHPNLRNALGYGSINNRTFFVKLNEGVVSGLDGREINLENSEFFVADTKKKPAIGEFQVLAVGETKDILTDLNKKPVKLLANSKLRPSDFNGTSNLKVDLVMP